jgi:hypothetical protein
MRLLEKVMVQQYGWLLGQLHLALVYFLGSVWQYVDFNQLETYWAITKGRASNYPVGIVIRIAAGEGERSELEPVVSVPPIPIDPRGVEY